MNDKDKQAEPAAFVRKGGTIGWNIDYSKLPYGTNFYTHPPADVVRELVEVLKKAKWMLERDYIDNQKMAVIEQCEIALEKHGGAA